MIETLSKMTQHCINTTQAAGPTTPGGPAGQTTPGGPAGRLAMINMT